MTTWPQLSQYLDQRASAHGLAATDLLAITPDVIDHNPDALMTFWQQKDISHVLPVSTHPELASDPTNVFPEDPGPNRARHDHIAGPLDQLTAWADNQIDAIKALLHLPVH
jgi:hypothetical protein